MRGTLFTNSIMVQENVGIVELNRDPNKKSHINAGLAVGGLKCILQLGTEQFGEIRAPDEYHPVPQRIYYLYLVLVTR